MGKSKISLWNLSVFGLEEYLLVITTALAIRPFYYLKITVVHSLILTRDLTTTPGEMSLSLFIIYLHDQSKLSI